MKDRGFSLVELVIVLVVMGVSIALVTPSLSRFYQRVELKTAAKTVSGILRYFRSESIQKGKVYQVLFDSNLREVRVQAMEEGTEGEGKKTEGEGKKDEEKALKKTYSLPAGVQMKDFKISDPEFSSDLPAIEFYPNGSSNGGSMILDGRDQKGYRIKVHFLTGIVEVEEV